MPSIPPPSQNLSTKSSYSITFPTNLKSMIAQHPNLRHAIDIATARRQNICQYFRDAVLKGNAKRVHTMQSSPSSSFDLDRTSIDSGLNALQTAAACGHSDLLRVLCHFGAAASTVDSFGHTALHFALERHSVHHGEQVQSVLSDVALLIGYTRIRHVQTNGVDTFVQNDIEQLQQQCNQHFLDELRNKYPEFELLHFA